MVENVGDADCTTTDGADPHSQKRTHTLSLDGGEIWDLGANVLEFLADSPDAVNDPSGDGYMTALNNFVSLNLFDDEEGPAGSNKLMWGPSGDHSAKADGGMGIFDDGIPNVTLRGGLWADNANAGVFGTALAWPAGISLSFWSFRCVWAP